MISASTYLQPRQRFQYFLSESQVGTTTLDPILFQLGFVFFWDTDRSMRKPKGVQQENIKYEILRRENKLSAWYWGIGPSAGLQLSKSSYLKNNYPFLYDDFTGGFIVDMTFGRHFSKHDFNIGFAYRPIGFTVKAFDTKLKFQRHSFMVEGYKYITNYLGFVPFVGVTGSYEFMSLNSNGQQFRNRKMALGVIAGWDIRVTKTGTSLLRTNLRWTPGLHMTIGADKLMVDQLEFNFIQWVQFIGRKKVYNRHRSKQ